ncbi:hypothetical protein [Demequina aurantiaca]|uniref:hypothetical protein n=1 Tax=Demequina aurantiaca TaxID=676200 RepID=UPI003D341001
MTNGSPPAGDGSAAEPEHAGAAAHGYDFAPPPLPGTAARDTTADAGVAQAGPAAQGATIRSGDRPPAGRPGRTRRGRRGRANGRWVFVTMIAAIALIVGGIGWAAVLDHRSSGVKPAELGVTGTLHTGQVVSGMCIKDAPAADSTGPVEVVRCSDPHHAEALVSYTFTSGEWPGTEQARAAVLTFCAAQLDPAVSGLPPSPDAPEFEWLAWVPSAQTWNLGDRTGVCVVTTERPVAGSYGAGTAHDATADAVIG